MGTVSKPIGPVSCAVFGFPGSNFSGEIAPALAELVDKGTIRVLDLVFAMKDLDGNVAVLELEEPMLRKPHGRASVQRKRDSSTTTTSTRSPMRSSRATLPRCSSGKTFGRPVSRRPCATPTVSSSCTSDIPYDLVVAAIEEAD